MPLASRDAQHLVHEAGSTTSLFVGRRDAGDLDVGPPEQHRERADVVGIATDVGVEMHQHGASVSVACGAVLAISLPDWLDQPTLRNVALGTMAGLAVLALLVAWLVRKVVVKLFLVVRARGDGVRDLQPARGARDLREGLRLQVLRHGRHAAGGGRRRLRDRQPQVATASRTIAANSSGWVVCAPCPAPLMVTIVGFASVENRSSVDCR